MVQAQHSSFNYYIFKIIIIKIQILKQYLNIYIL